MPRRSPRPAVRTLLLSVVVLALGLSGELAVSGWAVGADTRSARFVAAARLATISSHHGYPGVGGSAVLSGPLNQAPGGLGAEVDHITTTGHPSPKTFTYHARGIDYVTHGSERFVFSATSTLEPDGTIRLTGAGTITGGTDRYRRLSGRFTTQKRGRWLTARGLCDHGAGPAHPRRNLEQLDQPLAGGRDMGRVDLVASV